MCIHRRKKYTCKHKPEYWTWCEELTGGPHSQIHTEPRQGCRHPDTKVTEETPVEIVMEMCCCFQCCREQLTELTNKLRQEEHRCGVKPGAQQFKDYLYKFLNEAGQQRHPDLLNARALRDLWYRIHSQECVFGLVQHNLGITNDVRPLLSMDLYEDTSVEAQREWLNGLMRPENMLMAARKMAGTADRAPTKDGSKGKISTAKETHIEPRSAQGLREEVCKATRPQGSRQEQLANEWVNEICQQVAAAPSTLSNMASAGLSLHTKGQMQGLPKSGLSSQLQQRQMAYPPMGQPSTTAGQMLHDQTASMQGAFDWVTVADIERLIAENPVQGSQTSYTSMEPAMTQRRQVTYPPMTATPPQQGTVAGSAKQQLQSLHAPSKSSASSDRSMQKGGGTPGGGGAKRMEISSQPKGPMELVPSSATSMLRPTTSQSGDAEQNYVEAPRPQQMKPSSGVMRGGLLLPPMTATANPAAQQMSSLRSSTDGPVTQSIENATYDQRQQSHAQQRLEGSGTQRKR